jgi:hypothetical protein
MPYKSTVNAVLAALKEMSGDLDIGKADIINLADAVEDEYASGQVGTVKDVVSDLFDTIGYEEFGITELVEG